MSPIRGDVKKKFLPFLSEEKDAVACIQPDLGSGEAEGAPRIPDRPSQWTVSTRRFHDAIVVDAYGSGSYASRRVGFSGPTMVLFETRGLQLSLVMRGGIGCI